MSEMMIRRNNRGIPVARYPAAGKAEKTKTAAKPGVKRAKNTPKAGVGRCCRREQ